MDFKENPEIVVMRNSITFLRICFLFPSKAEVENPEKNMFIKFTIMYILGSLYPLGVVLHLVINIINGTPNYMDEDIILLLSYLTVSYFCWQYLGNVKGIVVICKKLSDFKTFGTPKDFDKVNKLLNKFSIIHFFCYVITISLMTQSNAIQINICRKENENRGINEICGMIGRMWLPFNYDYFPLKQFVILYQYYVTMLTYHNAGIINYLIIETALHINLRSQHLLQTFSEVIKMSDSTKRRRKFIEAVQYHCSITKLGKMLNSCCSQCFVVHLILTAPVLGTSLYKIETLASMNSFFLFIGFILAMCLACSTGQQLEDTSELLSDVLYQSEWYKLDVKLQRDLMFVMLRARRPNVLTAGPFGNMSYKTMVAIAKASYSYMALLQRKM